MGIVGNIDIHRKRCCIQGVLGVSIVVTGRSVDHRVHQVWSRRGLHGGEAPGGKGASQDGAGVRDAGRGAFFGAVHRQRGEFTG